MTIKAKAAGIRLPYTNATGSDIAAGDPVVVGNLVGIALTDIADTESGELGIGEVYTVPKVSGAVIAKGEFVRFDISAGAFDDKSMTQNDGDILDGSIAWESGADGETEIDVFLCVKGGDIGVTPGP